jgi:hypothetical protein
MFEMQFLRLVPADSSSRSRGRYAGWFQTAASRAMLRGGLACDMIMFKFELPVLTKARILVAVGTVDEMRTMRSHLQTQASTLKAHHFMNRTIQVLAHLALH